MLHPIKSLFLILCLSLFFGYLTSSAAEEELLVLTEKFPPFNYQEDNTIKGLSTQIVKELLKRVHLKCSIELVPWTRAYNTALNRPNTIIYTMAKTASRLNKFHWIGKISNRKVSLFRLRSRQDLASMTIEAAKEKATIAVTQGDASMETIREMGFSEKNITAVRDVTTGNLGMKHVLKGRSDFFPSNPYMLKYRVKIGEVPDLFINQFVIHDADGYYIAANIDTNPSIIKKLTDSYRELEEKGYIKQVVSEYLKF
ncbi:MAG: ABC transporter substrate-binding protein [Deltaproteobacteria bacterium]|nr:ABC transporter substrate-binding protein [Deltaproteobacteria bacterium]